MREYYTCLWQLLWDYILKILHGERCFQGIATGLCERVKKVKIKYSNVCTKIQFNSARWRHLRSPKSVRTLPKYCSLHNFDILNSIMLYITRFLARELLAFVSSLDQFRRKVLKKIKKNLKRIRIYARTSSAVYTNLGLIRRRRRFAFPKTTSILVKQAISSNFDLKNIYFHLFRLFVL